MTRKTVEGNEVETKVKATHSVAFETGGYGGREERCVVCEWAYRERNGIASRTRIGDGRLNLSISFYTPRVTHTDTQRQESKACLQAVEPEF
jgi:rubredoxin